MTTIRNGRGISAVQRTQDARVAGEPSGPGFDRPYENPLLPQISTLTLAAVADVSDEIVEDQVWTITLTDPDGVAYETDYTVTAADNTAGTDGAGLAYMAGRLAVAIEANGELVNIVSASAAAAVVTITWLHPNRGTWTVAAVCAPAAAEVVLLATALGTSGTLVAVVVLYYAILGIESLAGEHATAAMIVSAVAVYLGLLAYSSRYPELLPDDPAAPVLVLPQTWPTVRSGLHFLLPIVVLLWCLTIEELSPATSAFWAVATTMAIVVAQPPLRRRRRRPPSTWCSTVPATRRSR
jgi:hypothetical protein